MPPRFPLTAPATPHVALRGARRQAQAMEAPKLRIVTGCPSACRSFQRAGVDAMELFTVLERWVAARDEDLER